MMMLRQSANGKMIVRKVKAGCVSGKRDSRKAQTAAVQGSGQFGNKKNTKPSSLEVTNLLKAKSLHK